VRTDKLTGERVFLENPGKTDEFEFVRQAALSRALHHPWVEPPTTPAGFRAYLDRSAAPDRVSWLAKAVESSSLLGAVEIGNIVRGAFQSGYLGYYAFDSGAGSGYMTEALTLCIDHAFDSLGLHRLEANIQPANLASSALAQRLGFRFEGHSPRYLFITGAWRDHDRWAITVEDWASRPRPL
jgi:ribosomal-protein-alanine N-acetyltransferase